MTDCNYTHQPLKVKHNYLKDIQVKSARTNMKIIVKIMLERGEVTASDIYFISNSNQYFVALERLGIIGSRWHTRANGTKCKMRFIKDRAKALKFIGATE